MATNISGDTGVSQVQEGSITALDLVQTVADGVAKPMQIMRLAAKATTSGTDTFDAGSVSLLIEG